MILRCKIVLLACVGAMSGAPPFTNAAPTNPPLTEVVVIATQHFITDMPEGYTPAHLRALLEKVRPDVVAVEACMNVEDPWTTAPYELAKVTRPWAIEKRVQIVPIGWSAPSYGIEIGAMFNRFAAAGKETTSAKVEHDFQQTLAKQTTCVAMNGAKAIETWRDYHAKLHELNGGDTPWEKWNERIAKNLLSVCRKHAGKRIAVVFGGAHAYYFVDRLGKEPGVRVIATEEFFPLTAHEVRAATRDGDYLQAMRLLNFGPGSLTTVQLSDIEKRLAGLNSTKQYEYDYQYFRARLFLHRRKADKALEVLAELCKLKPDSTLAFDGVTPVRDASKLQSYFALMQQGEMEAATKTLRELATDKTTSLPMRQTAETLLNANGVK
jgi:hypothetical protein